MADISLEEARKAMIAKRFGGNVKGGKTGGEGSVRRKKAGTHKSAGRVYFSHYSYDVGVKCDIF